MSEQLAIGVDVGGTKIAAALTNRNGDILAHDLRETPTQNGLSAVLDAIAESIKIVALPQHRGHILGVGIGVPGMVNPDDGIAIHAVNMGEGWQNVALSDAVAQRLDFSTTILVENDVNAGGMGERIFGAAANYHDFVYITVGTGLGGCAVSGGVLLRGTQFAAMEIGHIVYDPTGRKGDFGLRGTTEMYISGKGFLAAYQEYRDAYPATRLVHPPQVSDILVAARHDDALAVKIVEDGAQALATAIAWCVTILNPEAVIIGGGLGLAARDVLDARVRQQLQKRIIPATFDALHIGYAQVTNSALGGAALVYHICS